MGMKLKSKRGKTSKVSIYQDALKKVAEKAGGLTAEAVVEAARPKSSPLHDAFEWSDSKAAREYRLEQARCLIRSIEICVTHGKSEVVTRAWAFLPSKQSYAPMVEAMGSDVTRDEILGEAKKELRVFRVKYGQLEELVEVIKAIDRTVRED